MRNHHLARPNRVVTEKTDALPPNLSPDDRRAISLWRKICKRRAIEWETSDNQAAAAGRGDKAATRDWAGKMIEACWRTGAAERELEAVSCDGPHAHAAVRMLAIYDEGTEKPTRFVSKEAAATLRLLRPRLTGEIANSADYLLAAEAAGRPFDERELFRLDVRDLDRQLSADPAIERGNEDREILDLRAKLQRLLRKRPDLKVHS
jgi:hypothetical protein